MSQIPCIFGSVGLRSLKDHVFGFGEKTPLLQLEGSVGVSRKPMPLAESFLK
jgi:hypothetical protein